MDSGVVAILIFMVCQSISAIWWASNITSRVKHLERQGQEDHEENRDIPERIARIEVLIEANTKATAKVSDDIQSINNYLRNGKS